MIELSNILQNEELQKLKIFTSNYHFWNDFWLFKNNKLFFEILASLH